MIIFNEIEAWCSMCNAHNEHWLRMVITKMPNRDEHEKGKVLRLPFRAFITCTICLSQYEMFPDTESPDE